MLPRGSQAKWIWCLVLVLMMPLWQNCSKLSSNNEGQVFSGSDEIKSSPADKENEMESNINSDVDLPPSLLIPEVVNSFSLIDVDILEETSSTIKVQWILSDVATGVVRYGLDPKNLDQVTIGEGSFKYSTHIQTIKNLLASTTYYFEIESVDMDGNVVKSDVLKKSTLTAPALPELLVDPNNSRDQFWKLQGYNLNWFSTPKEKEVGTSFEKYFRGSEWSNGYPLKLYFTNSGAETALTLAPDGSPAVKVILNPPSADKSLAAVHVRGNQFGPKGIDKKIVYSREFYYPCTKLGNAEILQYVGFGHMWASAPGAPTPSGSKRFVPNLGWTLRVPVAAAGSGTYFVYGYFPDAPEGKLSGTSFGSGGTKPTCGTWELMELELIQNKPASAKNASMRLFINGKLVSTNTGFRTREFDNVFLQGWGMFVNRGKLTKPATYYFKNQKMYLKDY